MCSLSQLLLYLLTGGKKKNYIISSWTACFGTLSVGRSHGNHVSVERQICINAFQFEFGNLYAVPELVIQVRIKLGS